MPRRPCILKRSDRAHVARVPSPGVNVSTRNRNTVAILLSAAFASLTWASLLHAQEDWEPVRPDDGELRTRTHEIITSPEFRHLVRSRGSSSRSPQSSSPRGEGDGEGWDGLSPDEVRERSRRMEGSKNSELNDRAVLRRLRELGRSMSRYRQRSRGDAEPKPASPPPNIRIPTGMGGVGGVIGPLFHGLAWLLVAAAVGVIVWLIYRAVMNWERTVKAKVAPSAPAVLEESPDRAPGDVPADEFVARARQLAAEGRFREAVAFLLLGAMSHIERAGLIRFRRGLTHRDYLRAVRPRKSSFDPMRAMIDVYEPLGFGRREATQRHFDATLSHYEAGFRATPALEQ